MQQLSQKKPSASLRLQPKSASVPSLETYPCVVRGSGNSSWEVVEIRSEKVHATYRRLQNAIAAAKAFNQGATIRKRLAELAEWKASVA